MNESGVELIKENIRAEIVICLMAEVHGRRDLNWSCYRYGKTQALEAQLRFLCDDDELERVEKSGGFIADAIRHDPHLEWTEEMAVVVNNWEAWFKCPE